jgi:hypothetical protein
MATASSIETLASVLIKTVSLETSDATFGVLGVIYNCFPVWPASTLDRGQPDWTPGCRVSGVAGVRIGRCVARQASFWAWWPWDGILRCMPASSFVLPISGLIRASKTSSRTGLVKCTPGHLARMVDGRLGSRLRGYNPIASRPIAASPLCTFSSARHLQRHSTSSDMRDFC